MNYKEEEKYIDWDGQELVKTTYDNGSIWYTNKEDKLHRLDGPAVIWYDGSEYWYKDGKRHRLDGPARIRSDGKEEYYLEGKQVSKREVDLLWIKKQVE